MVRAGGDKDSGEVDLGAGPLLGLLAAPSAFQCFLSLDKYSSLLNWFRSRTSDDLLVNSIPDKLLFIAISMAITGIVTVLKWDRILPDAQDFRNLAPLPIRPRTILAANVVAIGIAALAINIVVNVGSSALFPLFVSSASPDDSISAAPFMAVHALAVSVATLFAFLLVLAVMGTINAIFRGAPAEYAGLTGRVVLLVGFVVLVPLAVQSGASMRAMPDGSGMGAWFVPAWFLGLYQQLQDRGPAYLVSLAPMALKGIAVVFGVACLSCGLSYRRRFRAVFEVTALRSGGRDFQWLARALSWITPRRATCDLAIGTFAVHGLLRNDPHRMLLAGALGMGWLIAVQDLAQDPTSALIPAYLLVLALRIVFLMPAGLSANWIFRVAMDRLQRSATNANRRVALLAVSLFVVAPAALAYLGLGKGVGATLLSAMVLLCMSVLHIELLFGTMRQIPFTCAFPAFQQNLPMRCLLHVVGFAVFLDVGARFHALVLAHPAALLALMAAPAGLWWWHEREYREAVSLGDRDVLMSFENEDPDRLLVAPLSSAPLERV